MFYLSDHVTLSPRISIVVDNFSVPFPEIMGTHFDINIVSILHTISLPCIILFQKAVFRFKYEDKNGQSASTIELELKHTRKCT